MRAPFVGVLFILFNSLYAYAQDIKINVAELQCNSIFECKTFEAFQAKSPDYFALFSATDETVTDEQFLKWKTSFDKELESLKAELLSKKKNDKKVKFLYEKVHSRFLAKYESTNLFSQVFKDGVYNCVSATALYSMVFEYFSIPYSIQERPTHVYLVAYPENERVQIETTTPIGGFYVFDQGFKQNYIKKLNDYKIISAVEYQTKSVDDLFDKHFFNNENIDITKLVGIQYLNSGLFYLEKNENEKAYSQFEKSYFFYPNEKSRYLMYNILIEVFKGVSYSNEKKALYLAKLCQFTKEGINQDMITGEFYRISQTVFLQDGNKDQYEKIYTLLQNSIQDDETKKQISYIYNYENARTLYNQGRYKDASSFLEKALSVKPNNVDLTWLFIANLKQLEIISKDKTALISQLQQYAEVYPLLKENNNFLSLQADVILEAFATFYEKGNIKEGENHRLLFEDLLVKNPNLNTSIIDYQIGRAYSVACVHYFKMGQKSKAKVLVEKGLTYAPNNYQLRSRREALR